MPVVLLLAAAAILAGVLVVAIGRGGELAIFRSDVPPLRMEFATAAEMARFRPPPAFFGYSAQATDDALQRIARVVADREAELALLRRQLAALRAGPAGGSPATSVSPGLGDAGLAASGPHGPGDWTEPGAGAGSAGWPESGADASDWLEPAAGAGPADRAESAGWTESGHGDEPAGWIESSGGTEAGDWRESPGGAEPGAWPDSAGWGAPARPDPGPHPGPHSDPGPDSDPGPAGRLDE